MPLSGLIYFAVALFVIGNLYRIIRIVRMPVHLRWELYPVPHELRHKAAYGGSYMEESDWWLKVMSVNRLGEYRVMLQEILLLKGVREHNRSLWIWSWLMHWGLYLLIAAFGLTLAGCVMEACGLAVSGASAAGIGAALFRGIEILGWAAGIFGCVGTVGVLMMRLFSDKRCSFTSFATIFNLALLFALFASGVAVYIQGPGAFQSLFAFVKGLSFLGSSVTLTGFAVAHVAILAFFLIYFPFTHMTHMFLKYFTYHSVRWDDRPLEAGGTKEMGIAQSFKHPVGWSAPHIHGDGKKNWADIVRETGGKDG